MRIVLSMAAIVLLAALTSPVWGPAVASITSAASTLGGVLR